MIIDFSKIEEQSIQGFKGGNGQLRTRNFVDEDNKIMMSELAPGANIGYHKHEINSEIICIISGKGYVDFEGMKENVATGSIHYCPKGKSHALFNNGEEVLKYFAIVGEHH